MLAKELGSIALPFEPVGDSRGIVRVWAMRHVCLHAAGERHDSLQCDAVRRAVLRRGHTEAWQLRLSLAEHLSFGGAIACRGRAGLRARSRQKDRQSRQATTRTHAYHIRRGTLSRRYPDRADYALASMAAFRLASI